MPSSQWNEVVRMFGKNGKEAGREVVWRGSAALLYLNGGSDGAAATNSRIHPTNTVA